MKNILLIIIVLLNFNLFSQVESSNCNSNDSIENIYMIDAAKVALNYLYEIDSSNKTDIVINQDVIDTVLSAIIAIYNVQNIPERDSVFDILNIRAREPDINCITLKIDTTQSWTNNWKNLITLTGDSFIDSVTTKYNLTVKSYSEYSGLVTLQSDLLLNISALVDTFVLHQDIIYGDYGFLFMDGSEIYYNLQNDTNVIRFEYGWGDCPSGCGSHRSWVFNVYPDCSVEFVESYGDVIFQSVNNVNIDDSVNLFPNPNNGKFTVYGEKIEKIEVLNVLGKTIFMNNKINNNEQLIDITSFPKGIYFVNIVANNIKTTKTIIIQ